MMTLDDVNEIIAGLTYKPDWMIDLEHRWGAVSLVLRMKVEDSRNPGETVKVRGGRTLDLYRLRTMAPDRFLDWVFTEIMAMERHEAREWFRFHGELVDDPHAGEREQTEASA